MADAPQKLRNGRVIVYRVFDIAEEIDIRKAEEVVAAPDQRGRLEFKMKGQEAVIIRNAPFKFRLGPQRLKTREDEIFEPEVMATIWDYGTLSLAYQFEISPGQGFGEMFRFSSLFNNEMEIIQQLNQSARKKAEELVTRLMPALVRPMIWDSFEDYIIYFAEAIEGVGSPERLLKNGMIPELLLGEPGGVLAETFRDRVLEYAYQFGKDDLCVIDWNSAFVLEPSGQSDVVDVLEFALTHLLEVRFYDQLIDVRLNELYDAIGADRKRWALTKLFYSRFGTIAEEGNSKYMELSEVTERMGNSLKVVGDFYLARIFRAAIQRFRVHDWEASILRKMDILSKVPNLLQTEVNARRSHLLEIIIILLILWEIVSAALK